MSTVRKILASEKAKVQRLEGELSEKTRAYEAKVNEREEKLKNSQTVDEDKRTMYESEVGMLKSKIARQKTNIRDI